MYNVANKKTKVEQEKPLALVSFLVLWNVSWTGAAYLKEA